jgi:pyridinium-3,5-biscarboxylic acid mononucleotide synthase
VTPDLLQHLLQRLADGDITVAQATTAMATSSGLVVEHQDGQSLLDLGRAARTGVPEVILGSHKSAAQIVQLLTAMTANGNAGLVTRISADKAAIVCAQVPGAVHHVLPNMVEVNRPRDIGASSRLPRIAIVAAGTSDLPVADEAAITAGHLGAEVVRVTDVGVAGLDRLLARIGLIAATDAVVVVAGMEGALPSVLAGLIDRPLFAVPTSVGYGVSAGGFAALLSMLSSCAPGVAVVNIDNGFGAAVAAFRCARMAVSADVGGSRQAT